MPVMSCYAAFQKRYMQENENLYAEWFQNGLYHPCYAKHGGKEYLYCSYSMPSSFSLFHRVTLLMPRYFAVRVRFPLCRVNAEFSFSRSIICSFPSAFFSSKTYSGRSVTSTVSPL